MKPKISSCVNRRLCRHPNLPISRGLKTKAQKPLTATGKTKVNQWPNYADLPNLSIEEFRTVRCLQVQNGEKTKGVFSDQEMERRLKNCRSEMEALGVDAVLLSSFHNIKYHSDFMYCAFGRNYAQVITPDDNTTVSALIDGGQPWRRSYGDNVVYTDWQRCNFYYALRSLFPSDSLKVGVEMDTITPQFLSTLHEMFPKFEFKDISNALMRRRMVKSREEINVIADASKICCKGGWAVVDAVDVGVREIEVAGAATGLMRECIAAVHSTSEFMDTWTWFQSGINTDGAHNPLTTRKLEEGDILSSNTFCHINGYYTALERTMFLGHVPDAHYTYWEKLAKVHKLGLTLIKPGVRCMDIANQLNEYMAELEILRFRTFGYGHSFGILSHYYGREGAVELREDVETVLEPGMVVSMEPMIMVPEGFPGAGGYREHDIFEVTANGAINLTDFPYGPDTACVIRK